ncbi:MAG: SOS response-associated peptidase [Bacteroidetes bacterium]|nr:SOS response-associated peptidase [Bacteroidota bacterium]MDA1121549.1 SOS response-associated peptidase [Bacteroidota bacterium]
MCSRYALTSPSENLHKRFKLDVTEAYKPTYNAAPTNLLPVITNQNPKGFSFFYWGATPKMANDKTISAKLYNARSDELTGKASYRIALESRRCLVPANGYYDWKRIGKKGRIPYWIYPETRDEFSFAGIWEEYDDDDGRTEHVFRIITVPTNGIVDSNSDQMPAILNSEDEIFWLNSNTQKNELMSFLKSYPLGKMRSHSVSTRLNNTSVNEPSLIEHLPPTDQFGNYTLFS